MTYLQVIERFRTQVKIAEFLDTKQPNIARWVRQGYIPDDRQIQLHLMTGGALQCDAAVLRRKPWMKPLLLQDRAA